VILTSEYITRRANTPKNVLRLSSRHSVNSSFPSYTIRHMPPIVLHALLTPPSRSTPPRPLRETPSFHYSTKLTLSQLLSTPCHFCTPIFCFLETHTYWSASFVPPPQPLRPSPLLSPPPTLHTPLRPRYNFCTPIFCFLETHTYWSAIFVPPPQPLYCPHLLHTHLTPPHTLRPRYNFCTPIFCFLETHTYWSAIFVPPSDQTSWRHFRLAISLHRYELQHTLYVWVYDFHRVLIDPLQFAIYLLGLCSMGL